MEHAISLRGTLPARGSGEGRIDGEAVSPANDEAVAVKARLVERLADAPTCKEARETWATRL